MRRSICYRLLRSNKSQSGQKNPPESHTNESFFSLSNRKAPLCLHSEVRLVAEIVGGTAFM